MRGEDVSLIGDGLLAEHVRETGNASGADHCAGDCSAAIGKWSDRLLDFVVIGVAAEGDVVFSYRAVERGRSN